MHMCGISCCNSCWRDLIGCSPLVVSVITVFTLNHRDTLTSYHILFVPDCFCKQERHGDHFLCVVIVVIIVSNVKSVHFKLCLSITKAFKLIATSYTHLPWSMHATHTVIDYYWRCDVDLLFTLGWTMFSLCILMSTTSTLQQIRRFFHPKNADIFLISQ